MGSPIVPVSAPTTVVKWVLDTRSLWPEAKETKDLQTAASRALALLTPEEQQGVLRFYHVKDAKLALGSSLLKRLAISTYCGVGWDAARWTRDARTKPVFLLPDASEPLLFNVSHQAGLVVLLAVHGPPLGTAIGVDVVCPPERRSRDHAMIAADGWPQYVDIHADVFSPGEAARLKALPFIRLDRLLSYFYSLWCLREAYVKMTGDALLALWLRELDLRYFAPPGEVPPDDRGFEIWFREKRVDDVDMRLEWLLDEYMVCTAVRWGKAYEEPDEGIADMAKPFTHLKMDQVLADAEAAREMKR
ncbi:L-aminoadipate-semialdehyde dehydrogenase-phosphopantetheinyl transferase [Tolypocladium ophioglossoides CBS 100239]|uniref:holo-[acyl-carrier-protein] synthase n=1 Tax=Tolypocladium ophioglossoides (strain CBS 100239) TaxID=1163406 RepID=A0A0L0N7C6_TOLOC|nr:L-aminoadipate-semialdehyde dehydrogenase-phosphopantetheinyl transferase [Tolypocladium ophioglossoides CBS 100239]